MKLQTYQFEKIEIKFIDFQGETSMLNYGFSFSSSLPVVFLGGIGFISFCFDLRIFFHF